MMVRQKIYPCSFQEFLVYFNKTFVKILVTDGNNRASLAITRSLGRKGFIVYVGSSRISSIASSSKYCINSFKYPHPRKDHQGFIDQLILQIKQHNIDIIIPVSDISTFLVAKHRTLFEEYCKLPFPSEDSVKLAADKAGITALAQESNIPVPETIIINNATDLNSVIDSLRFPVVIKPSRSRIEKGNDWIFTTVKYANNKDELISCINKKDVAEFPVLLQERIYGPGIGIFACYNRGKMIAQFSHRRIREKPPSGGVSVLRESVPVNTLALRYSQNLLDQLKWHGVAMVEFKLDKKDSIPKLMEINGRFWGSLQLAIDAGIDFPNILVATMLGKQVEPIIDFKYGIKSRWFWGDVDLLIMRLFKNNATLNLPKDYDGRLECILSFLKLWEKNLNYEVLRLDDIKPWLCETRQWFKELLAGYVSH